MVAILGLALPGAARVYGWPVKPFNEMHAIRGSFDDPRFHLRPDLTTSASFHFGVDISVPTARPVYAVEPGVVVRGPDREPAPAEPAGVRLLARPSGDPHRTARPAAPAPRLRRARMGPRPLRRDGRRPYRNPLRYGALTPYRELTAPVVDAISVTRLDGHTLQVRSRLAAVTGTVGFIADATSSPRRAARAVEPRGSCRASCAGQAIPANGDPPTAWRIAADFRYRLSGRSARSRASTRPARTRTSRTARRLPLLADGGVRHDHAAERRYWIDVQAFGELHRQVGDNRSQIAIANTFDQ